ncbi:MAG: glycoside hydrolase family 18 [Bacteroidales bacterium]|nr:glycoside hydrolase family 18 [Bacteroidales bacterium]MDY6001433.1 glycoside hydrolase family 18 [Candidatus Cryptobacteroides sp.]
MKFNILLKALIPAFAFLALTGCDDWTTPEPKEFDSPLTEVLKDDAYYEALRAYKASDHSVAFGWYSEWGEGGVATTDMLQAVPDSMDIISLWNNANLTPAKKADLDFVTKVKGTKVLICSFIPEVGCFYSPGEYTTVQERRDYWGWKSDDDDAIHNSIIKWTKAVADSLSLYGFSGIDIDYEPGEYGGALCRNSQYFTWFVEEMGKYIGPQSKTDKIFVVDGYYIQMPNAAKLAKYFDYFVNQAYITTAANLQYRLNNTISAFSSEMSEEEITKKFIVTENLESAMDCLNGGYYWRDSDNYKWDKKIMPSLVGYADWKPSNGFRKGGFGAYRFSNEKVNNPPYKWMRKAIQQQNPAPGKEIIKK